MKKSEDNEGKVELIQQESETYEIDFDRVNDLDDVINVLKGLKLRVNNPIAHGLGDLMPYLKKIEE